MIPYLLASLVREAHIPENTLLRGGPMFLKQSLSLCGDALHLSAVCALRTQGAYGRLPSEKNMVAGQPMPFGNFKEPGLVDTKEKVARKDPNATGA